MINIKEKDIQKAIMDYLQYLENMGKCYVVRTQSGQIFIDGRKFQTGKPGTPDILLCYNGKFYGIEVKRHKGKQSKAQKEAQDRIEKAKGNYILAYSLDDIQAVFQ